jgi:hypothetical protein
MYQKNPVNGARLHFDRPMKKAKRLCNEGFIRDILYRQNDCVMRGLSEIYFIGRSLMHQTFTTSNVLVCHL